jgi:predicted kinase
VSPEGVPELAVLIGLPASGKSTFYRERLALTHVHVSKDLMPNNRRRGDRERELIVAALARGASVAVDNTHPRRADREALISLGHGHGARVVGYYFPSDVAGALERNKGREGRARVPPVAIFAAAKRLEEPSAAEGFDQLFRVERCEPSGFAVGAWQGP